MTKEKSITGGEVEALRKEIPEFKEHDMSRAMDIGWAAGWNKCLDHLASTGRIRGEWRPISEAPRDGTKVIVLDLKGYISQAYFECDCEGYGWVCVETNGEPDVRLTHFMPLPAAPGGE